MTDTPQGAPVPGGRGPNGTLAAWQRPPFQSSNTLSLSHGANSERVVQPLAAAMVKTALDQCQYLRDPSFEPALLSWARIEAKSELLHRWLDDHGMVDEETGKVRDAAKILSTFENTAAKLRTVLGLDPVSRAKLMRDTAATQVDLAQLMAQEGTE